MMGAQGSREGKGSLRKAHFARLKPEEERWKPNKQGPWGGGGRGVRAT